MTRAPGGRSINPIDALKSGLGRAGLAGLILFVAVWWPAGPAGPAGADDPSWRRLVPVTVRVYSQSWIRAMAARPEVAFIIPHLSRDPWWVLVRAAPDRAGVQAAVRPTGRGDPLILENGGRIPSSNECVLSADLARSLGVEAGGRVTIEIVRRRAGLAETAQLSLEVASVLGPRVGGRRFFVRLKICLALDDFQEGRAAIGLNWPGRWSRVEPRYDGILVRPRRRFPGRVWRGLIKLGLRRPRRLAGRRAQAAALGLVPWRRGSIYLFSAAPGSVSTSTLARAARIVGRRGRVGPYVKHRRLEVCRLGSCQKMKVFGFSTLFGPGRPEDSPPVPWPSTWMRPGQRRRLEVLVPDSMTGVRPGQTLILKAPAGPGQGLILPLTVVGVRPGLPGLVVPMSLSGVLRAAGRVPVRYDARRGLIQGVARVFPSFRLYAAHRDQVGLLVRLLADQGIEVRSRLADIRRAWAQESDLARLMDLILKWDRVRRDPGWRLIRPGPGGNFDRAWFERLRKRPQVAWISPEFRPMAARVRIRPVRVSGAGRVVTDLVRRATGNFFQWAPAGVWPLPPGVPGSIVPTGPGDPVLDRWPVGRQGVLSSDLARRLKVGPGDRIALTVTRRTGNRPERRELMVQVISVAGPRAGAGDRLFLPLNLAAAVADYKDGLAVGPLGWPGRVRLAHPVYDGFLLWFDQTPDRFLLENLTQGTGLTRWRAVSPDRLADLTGLAESPSARVYLLSVRGSPVGHDSWQAVRRRVGDMMIVPWVRPLTVLASRPSWPLPELPGPIRLFGLSAERLFLKLHGLAVRLPWGGPRENLDPAAALQVLAPARPPGFAPGQRLTLTLVGTPGGTLSFPVTVQAVRSDLTGLVAPSELAGLIRAAGRRTIRFDPRPGRFVIVRRAFHGWRLYARRPSDVAPLVRFLADQGLTSVYSRARELTRLIGHLRRAVARSPYRFFWLVTAGLGRFTQTPAVPSSSPWTLLPPPWPWQ
jgi:putative ABC transport system permease protein